MPATKRWTTRILVGAGLAVLLGRAAVPREPWSLSLSVARRFWGANRTTRLLNAPGLAPDRELLRLALERDREWPPSWDVLLVVGLTEPQDAAEATRRRLAYVLSPRRVRIERRPVPGQTLEPAPGRSGDGAEGRP